MFTKTNEFICLSIRQSIRQHAIEHFLIKDVHKQKKKCILAYLVSILAYIFVMDIINMHNRPLNV